MYEPLTQELVDLFTKEVQEQLENLSLLGTDEGVTSHAVIDEVDLGVIGFKRGLPGFTAVSHAYVLDDGAEVTKTNELHEPEIVDWCLTSLAAVADIRGWSDAQS